MHSKAFVETHSLKDFLSLFSQDSELKNLTLGDTQYPSSGFVDEELFKGCHQISELLVFNYDFKGLVHFEAEIKSMKLRLISSVSNSSYEERYEICGTNKDIAILKSRVIEKNTYHPEKYKLLITSNDSHKIKPV